jgi:hypothetical protein
MARKGRATLQKPSLSFIFECAPRTASRRFPNLGFQMGARRRYGASRQFLFHSSRPEHALVRALACFSEPAVDKASYDGSRMGALITCSKYRSEQGISKCAPQDSNPKPAN